MPREEARARVIEDSSTGVNLKVNADGSLNVIPQLTPESPSGAVPVIISAFGDVASVDGVDTYYTITSGETLTIQTLIAGAEYDGAGSIVELFYDPNGDLSVLIRLSALFINGASDNNPVNQEFIGNGTRRIVLRRRGFGANAREVFGQWIGYEE